MNKDLQKQLREASFVRGKEKTWVSKLSDGQLQEIFLRLKNGESAGSIARHIKKFYRTLADSSVSSLSKGVFKYKGRIKHLLYSSLPGHKTANRNVDNLSGIERLEYLAERQLHRILLMIDEEQEGKIFNVNISKEIDSLTAFQKAINKTQKSKVVNTEQANLLSSGNMVVRSISQMAASMTLSMTERDKVEKFAEAVDMVRTMMAIDMGARLLGDEIREELFKKYPSIKRLLPFDVITINEGEAKN